MSIFKTTFPQGHFLVYQSDESLVSKSLQEELPCTRYTPVMKAKVEL